MNEIESIKVCYYLNCKDENSALMAVAQLVGIPCHRLKGHGFDTQSGHIPRFWFVPGQCVWRRQPLSVSLSYPCFSLSPSFLSPLSEINEHVHEWALKKINLETIIFSIKLKLKQETYVTCEFKTKCLHAKYSQKAFDLRIYVPVIYKKNLLGKPWKQ